jgi:hypothetical protein
MGWVEAPTEDNLNGVLKGILYNPGEEDVILGEIVSPNADEVTAAHSMMMDGMTQMNPMESARIVVEAGKAVVFSPLHYQIELVNLQLGDAETVDVVFNFEGLGDLSVTLPLHHPMKPEMGDMEGMDDGMEMMPTYSLPYMSLLSGTCAGVVFVNTYTYPTIVPNRNGGVFGTLINLGEDSVTLVGGESPIANVIEIHETVMLEDDVMQMQPLADGLTIEGQSAVELMSGGLHIMVIDVPEPTEVGQEIELTLQFADETTFTLTVPVVERMGEGDMHMEGMEH